MLTVPQSEHAATSVADSFISDLTTFASTHKASRWRGTFGEFLENVVPANPGLLHAQQPPLHVRHVVLVPERKAQNPAHR